MPVFFKAAACQCRFILKQKGCLFTFALLLAWVLINFVGNVLTFQGMDAAEMYQPMKLLLLSYNRINYNADFTLLLVQLYPFLVACPAAFSLIKERQTGQEVLMSARLGRFPYFMGKLAAVMAVTAAVFTLPFLIEILLNCIAFPLNAQGDLTNWGAYDPDYVASVKHYLCYPLYLFSPYLYAVCGTLLFGLMSGVLGGFVITFSALFPIKYSVVLFLPAFLLLNATVYFSQIQTVPFQSGWYHYFLLFDDTVKSPLYLIAGLLLLLIVSIAGCVWGGKQDCLR